jgi:hypothetical protein
MVKIEIDKIKNKLEELNKRRFTDKKHYDVVLWRDVIELLGEYRK